MNLMIPKRQLIRDETYRRYVASQPCLVCGGTDVQAAHIAYGRHSLSLKSGDDLTMPLCIRHHQEHDKNQEAFWNKYFKTVEVAKLWRNAEYRIWEAVGP